MPPSCPWSSRCGNNGNGTSNTAVDNTLPSPSSSPDVESWQLIRRRNLRMMRKQVRTIVLLMALIEVIRIGPVDIVFAGREGQSARGPEDFGIAYSIGYFLSWLYLCVFMIIWTPLFSWWVPLISSASKLSGNTPSSSSTVDKVINYLRRLNLLLLPACIVVHLVTYVYYALETLVYVDHRTIGSKKFPKNTRKNWLVRLLLLVGVLISTTGGYGAFQILADMDLAHVKPLEYVIIVVPVQINLGILFGTLMQFKMEKRIARKQKAEGVGEVMNDVAVAALHAPGAVTVDAGVTEEKAALIEV
ncbi:hypothetical protein KCU88_g107, partial [Aureobasidium melanogenum]